MTSIRLSTLLLTLAALLPAQPGRFGTPACPGPDRELADRSFFLLCHSASRKVPLWVGYELKPEHLVRLASRPSHFRHDAGLSAAGSSNSDYSGSGFSRGHLAPAADFAWSDAALRATFLLSNAVPQIQSVNAGRWAQLEAVVRRIAAHASALYVFSGPLFESDSTQLIGAGGVAVPSHTFKVVLAIEGQRMRMYAAIVPNAAGLSETLDHFATTVDEVERRAGLDFFDALDGSQEQLESTLEPLPARARSR